MRTLSLELRPLGPSPEEEAPLVHAVYRASPGYFTLIGMELPTLEDVLQDLNTLAQDARRRAFLLFQGPEPLGYLDYKLHYPEEGDATLSLLLIREDRQGQGLGEGPWPTWWRALGAWSGFTRWSTGITPGRNASSWPRGSAT